MKKDEMLELVKRTKINTVKLHIGEAFSTDPIDVQDFIEAGVQCFVLRTDDGLKGMSYQEIQRLIELPGGIAGFSYASLFHKYPDLQWWLEIGNEPDMGIGYNDFSQSPWVIRWWELAVIKELKLNFIGHIDEAWEKKYPMLKWAISLPVNRYNAQIVTQWMNYEGGDDISDGGVLDYYDAAALHLYGDTEVLSWNYDWPKIYNDMIQNQFCKKILITEMGINDPDMSKTEKARKYRKFMETAHPKVEVCTIWAMARHSSWPNYEVNELRDWEIITGLNQ
jgi:hypothetical protein